MEREYLIQNFEHDFYTGFIGDGRQVLMGPLYPELVLIEFDAFGDFVGVQTRLETQRQSQVEDQNAWEHRYDAYYETLAQVETWQTELGYRPGTIRVHRFFLADRGLGIRDLPDHYQELLPYWREKGCFVLWWGRDFWMDADGDVAST